MLKNNYVYNAKVIKVVDGDTIDVKIDLGFAIFIDTRIRLASIDTMETNAKDPSVRAMGLKAKNYLEALILGKTVTLETFKSDKYGRYLATVYLGGRSVNLQLIQEGLAVYYYGGKKETQLNLPIV
jgi:micrococcal nuclease